MAIVALALNFLGSIFLIWAGVKVKEITGAGELIISTLSKKWWYCGLWFLVFGFLLQLIERL